MWARSIIVLLEIRWIRQLLILSQIAFLASGLIAGMNPLKGRFLPFAVRAVNLKPKKLNDVVTFIFLGLLSSLQ